jgi:septal ring factor EnvC (AmiA/AmiB activator)
MIKQYRVAFAVLLGSFVVNISVSAQSDHLRVAVANLHQDVALLAQQVNTLRLEIEALRRENTQLRTQLASVTAARDTPAHIADLSMAIDTLRREYRQADERQQAQIIAEVSRQIHALGQETQAALNILAEAAKRAPAAAASVHFAEDYPKTGQPYVVRSGDTLSGIARTHGSTVKHIQNANKIVDPARDLRVGETIFIPIAE